MCKYADHVACVTLVNLCNSCYDSYMCLSLRIFLLNVYAILCMLKFSFWKEINLILGKNNDFCGVSEKTENIFILSRTKLHPCFSMVRACIMHILLILFRPDSWDY